MTDHTNVTIHRKLNSDFCEHGCDMDQGDRDGADQRHPDPAQPPPALVQVVLRALEPPPVLGEGLRHVSPAVLRRRRALGDRPGAHAARGKGTRKRTMTIWTCGDKGNYFFALRVRQVDLNL